jgi:hypothetical protein
MSKRCKSGILHHHHPNMEVNLKLKNTLMFMNSLPMIPFFDGSYYYYYESNDKSLDMSTSNMVAPIEDFDENGDYYLDMLYDNALDDDLIIMMIAHVKQQCLCCEMIKTKMLCLMVVMMPSPERVL